MALNLTIDVLDSVRIGEIEVKYLKRIGRKVSIAISAPKEMKINIIKNEMVAPEIEYKPRPSRDSD